MDLCQVDRWTGSLFKAWSPFQPLTNEFTGRALQNRHLKAHDHTVSLIWSLLMKNLLVWLLRWFVSRMETVITLNQTRQYLRFFDFITKACCQGSSWKVTKLRSPSEAQGYLQKFYFTNSIIQILLFAEFHTNVLEDKKDFFYT